MAVEVHLRGSLEAAYELVDGLRDADLDVTWQPPDQERGGLVSEIVVGLIVSGTATAVEEAVRTIVGRMRRRGRSIAEVEVQDLDRLHGESDEQGNGDGPPGDA